MASGNPELNQDATPFSRLPQLTAEDRAALAARNITTVEQFLARQAEEPKLMHQVGLPDWKAMRRVADGVQFAVNQRWNVLPRANEALASATSLTHRWLRVRLPDITVGAALVLLSVGAYRGCSSPTGLVAPLGLTPFQLIK